MVKSKNKFERLTKVDFSTVMKMQKSGQCSSGERMDGYTDQCKKTDFSGIPAFGDPLIFGRGTKRLR